MYRPVVPGELGVPSQHDGIRLFLFIWKVFGPQYFVDDSRHNHFSFLYVLQGVVGNAIYPWCLLFLSGPDDVSYFLSGRRPLCLSFGLLLGLGLRSLGAHSRWISVPCFFWRLLLFNRPCGLICWLRVEEESNFCPASGSWRAFIILVYSVLVSSLLLFQLCINLFATLLSSGLLVL